MFIDMKRSVLHIDINNCYASIECLHRPELRGLPVAVGGSVEARHGIILAKNDMAKRFGVKTGEALWQAKQKCRDLVVIPPNMPLYSRFCMLARQIYLDYTDQMEPFGMDEAWLDVTGSGIFGSGEEIAQAICARIKAELGITVSIGVSFNKVFAKLGSDYKKPDAVTLINEQNFKDIVWPLPASDLLYVGRAAAKRLGSYGIHTIGDIARLQPQLLEGILGKWGLMLHAYANGLDSSPVRRITDEPREIKSIGNSTTTPRDIKDNEDVRMVIYMLAESVCARMRAQGFHAKTVVLSVRDVNLHTFERQCKLENPSCLSGELAGKAFELFQKNYSWYNPIRSIGVRACDLVYRDDCLQLDIYTDEEKRIKRERMEKTVDSLRSRFGDTSIQRALLLSDRKLIGLDEKEEQDVFSEYGGDLL